MIWTWLKSKRPAISKTWLFGGMDAGNDLCLYPDCGVARKVHGKAHKFVEREDLKKEK